MPNKRIKTFNFKVSEYDTFHKFQIIAVYRGLTTHKLFSQLLKAFVEHDEAFEDKKVLHLVTEPELLDLIAKHKYPGNRSKLSDYRKRGVLQDDPKDKSTRWWYTNPSGNIVYNWIKMKPFFEDRVQRPYSRLNK